MFDTGAELTVPQGPFGVGMGCLLFETIHAIHRAFAGFHGGRFLFANLPLAQLIQTYVCYDPVQPGVEAAIEPERMEVPEDPEKSLLIHVSCVLRRPEEVHGKSKHTLVVGPYQLLERVLVTRLGRPD